MVGKTTSRYCPFIADQGSTNVCSSEQKLQQRLRFTNKTSSTWRQRLLLWKTTEAEASASQIWSAIATKSAYCGGRWSHEVCLLRRPLEPRSLLTVEAAGAAKSAYCGGRWSHKVCLLWRPLEPRSLLTVEAVGAPPSSRMWR